MACDTCGQTGTPLTDLREIYATERVKQVCGECEKVINKHLHKVQEACGKAQRGLMRRFLDNLRGHHHDR